MPIYKELLVSSNGSDADSRVKSNGSMPAATYELGKQVAMCVERMTKPLPVLFVHACSILPLNPRF